MEQPLKNKIALITGASAGIGAATARVLARAGSNLILFARRQDRLDQLRDSLKSEFGVQVQTAAVDVRHFFAIEEALSGLPNSLKEIDLLINNAGLALGMDKAYENNPAEVDQVVDVNIKGVLYLTRLVTPGMIERGRGHIVNISSIAGHEAYGRGSVYCGTKHAVDAITKSTRIDLVETPIRVTAISPGLVETEFSIVRFSGDTDRARKMYAGLEPLLAEDIADAVFYAVSRPSHVQIADMIILATAQASASVVHRE